jgi:hypothetical protein
LAAAASTMQVSAASLALVLREQWDVPSLNFSIDAPKFPLDYPPPFLWQA